MTSVNQRLMLLLEVRYPDDVGFPAVPHPSVDQLAELEQRVAIVELYQEGHKYQRQEHRKGTQVEHQRVRLAVQHHVEQHRQRNLQRDGDGADQGGRQKAGPQPQRFRQYGADEPVDEQHQKLLPRGQLEHLQLGKVKYEQQRPQQQQVPHADEAKEQRNVDLLLGVTLPLD